MGFDVKRALAEIEEQKNSAPETATDANAANRANPTIEPRLAQIARLARTGSQDIQNPPDTEVPTEVIILKSIDAGNRRHGAVATSTKLGATVTYQLIERLRSAGRVFQATDGALSVMEQKNEP